MTPVDDQALALASHLLAVDRPDSALEQVGRLSAEAATSERAWLLRTQALLALERPGDAVNAARRGMGDAGPSTGLLYLLSIGLVQLQDLPGAEGALLGALQLDPEDPQLLAAYARLLLRAGQLDKAARVLDEAARVAPESPALAEARALHAYVRGGGRLAASASREVLRRDPDSAVGRALLAGAAAERADFRSAARLYGGLAAESADRDLRTAARATRAYRSAWMWPLWPLARFGPGPVWLASLGIVLALRALELSGPLVVFVLCYLAIVVYSWVAPAVVTRWARR